MSSALLHAGGTFHRILLQLQHRHHPVRTEAGPRWRNTGCHSPAGAPWCAYAGWAPALAAPSSQVRWLHLEALARGPCYSNYPRAPQRPEEPCPKAGTRWLSQATAWRSFLLKGAWRMQQAFSVIPMSRIRPMFQVLMLHADFSW